MATDLSQDSVLQFLRSAGGSAKNADLLLHFRDFIRDHADRDRNRELFKKCVNTLATVQQLDGVSYVVLRRKFKGRVPGGGEGDFSGPQRPSPGMKRDSSPGTERLSPAVSAEKPRKKVQPREVTTSAPQGVNATKTILPAAGIMLNNNNNVKTNLNLKQHPETNKPGLYGGPAAAQTPSLPQPAPLDQSTKIIQSDMRSQPPAPGITPVVSAVRHHGETRQQVPVQQPPLRGRDAELKTPSFSEPPAQDWSSKIGQHNVGFAPPSSGITPVVSAVRQHVETSQQIPVQEPYRGREAEVRTPSFSEPPAQDWSTKTGQSKVGFAPPSSSITPVVSGVRQHGEPRQQITVQEPYRGKEAELKTPGFSEPPAQDWSSKAGQRKVGFAPPSSGITPVVSGVRQHVETRQQIQVQEPYRGREAEVRTPSFSEPPASDQSFKMGQQVMGSGPPAPGITPVVPVRHTEETFRVPETIRGTGAGLQPGGGLHQEPPPPNQVNVKSQVVRRHRHRKSYKSAVSYDEDEQQEEEEEEEEVPARRCSAGGEWPLSVPLGNMGKAISASSPCIIDVPSVAPSSSSEKSLPKIYVQDVEVERPPPRGGPGWSFESGAGIRGQWAGAGLGPGSIRHSLEAEHHTQSSQSAPHYDVYVDRRFSQPAAYLQEQRVVQQNQRGSLSSSTSNIYSPSPDSGLSIRDWPMSGSPRGSGWNSSLEDLPERTGHHMRSRSPIQEVLQRAQKTRAEPSMLHAGSKVQTPWHHSTGHLLDDQEHKAHSSPFHHSSDYLHENQQSAARVKPWHLSTGDLYDDHREAELSESSTPSPTMRQHAGVPRRLSSHLRSRMCRSMGADLDQLLPEEVRGGGGGGSEAARLNRLHLISSSLSLRCGVSSSSLSSCSTPPRSHSMANLTEATEGGGGKKSIPSSSTAAHPEGSGRQSQVPLESREHDWLVKGAAGAWPDIYSLFRDDSTLLNRQDFISGFTVLHWIAKHGDHRVLNTLWYGVQKAGLAFDINARSTCGHTPLHIAAIHGHKSIMRLLVSKFNADVKLRDTAGKKPWQYLSSSSPPDVFQLLGAPARVALGVGNVAVGRSESFWKPEKQQRRRRKHHLSSASSAERPMSISAKVKRSSSIAAFLKHKTLRHLHGHQSDSSV
ncbi:ankyrin repeat domain-containing protein SOWAHB-like [Notolabrus celidotus]|uniref:ankyrin repeat domain-containing protein SOWAHB-like n=1 Tax=Notolabrus celidotus TaxID=1203425 RepID=UPI001490103C|nr:ankyrin repeat domain-containing protein SOWAHB-like [Notolabrus celidotus]